MLRYRDNDRVFEETFCEDGRYWLGTEHLRDGRDARSGSLIEIPQSLSINLIVCGAERRESPVGLGRERRSERRGSEVFQ